MMIWCKAAIDAAAAQISYVGEPPDPKEIKAALDAAWVEQAKYLWPPSGGVNRNPAGEYHRA